MCAEEDFEKFWLSTGGKPGANRLYCLAGWKAHREFAEALKPSHNSAMDAISALRDLYYACIRADAAGELSAIVDGSLLDRAKDVLKLHQ